MALFHCTNVSFRYDGQIAAKDLNFEIYKGDYLCIVGENGSGKTTLIKGLLGLIPIYEGTIEIGDGLHTNEIGYLPQQTIVQKDFPASVYEVVLSGRLNRMGGSPFYYAEDKKEALRNMERLGITYLKDQCYRELSGGQQQRVLLARALCATKTMLLLDEPAAGLDPIVTYELYSLLQEINRAGITIVMVSHDIQAAISYSDHILHLATAQLFFGTTLEYKNSEIGQHFLEGQGHA